MRVLLLVSLAGLSLACAEGSTVPSSGGAGGALMGTAATSSGAEASTSTVASSSSGGLGDMCPPDQFATGIDAMGKLTCATIDTAAKTSVNAGCSVYAGWSDGCNGCGTLQKWGRVSGTTCSNGIGSNGTCTMANLGGTTVSLFGLNTGGDVDGTDAFYGNLFCGTGTSATSSGPCNPGQLATAIDGSAVSCMDVDSTVLGYVRSSCSLYMGWRDSCDSCSLAPLKWASSNSLACSSGVGVDNTCTTPIAGNPVPMFGLNTDGDVNDDDKYYVGLSCLPATPMGTTSMGPCPAGQFVVATHDDGSVECESPTPLVEAWFKAHCTLYFGWIDSCSGCTSAPGKWGQVRDGFCANGTGVNDTCSVASLAGANVSLFGLNTDGNVNDDDKFYFGFTCN